jgi:hypothetical protein
MLPVTPPAYPEIPLKLHFGSFISDRDPPKASLLLAFAMSTHPGDGKWLS